MMQVCRQTPGRLLAVYLLVLRAVAIGQPDTAEYPTRERTNLEHDMEQTDVADRNDTEAALTEVKESFDALFENAPVMMHSIGPDGRLVKANRL